jgi:hypothetical protein
MEKRRFTYGIGNPRNYSLFCKDAAEQFLVWLTSNSLGLLIVNSLLRDGKRLACFTTEKEL